MRGPLAHLVPTGLGPWGDGMARLVLQPLDLLLLLALVLLALQSGRSWLDRLALMLPLGWLVGGLGGLIVGVELPLALPCAAIVTAMGVLVTLGPVLRLGELLGERLLLTAAGGLALPFGLMAGSSLAGHGGALPALLASPGPAGGRQLDRRLGPADAGLAEPPPALMTGRCESPHDSSHRRLFR